MRRVVIESPFSSGTNPSIVAVVERNIRYVRACLRDCLLRDEAPYASHAIYTLPGVLDDNDLADRKRGMEAGWAYLPAVELTAVYTDLGMSSGMLSGIENAKTAARPIEERSLGGIWIRCGNVGVGSFGGCSSPDESPGSRHHYSCPFWRKQ